VDILDAVKSAPVVDLALLIGLGVFFFLGVMQGAIRRLIGILSMLFAFLVAANMRDSAGDFLAQNWRQFNLDYNRLLAFVIIFVVVGVAASIVTQGFYKRTDLSAEHPIVDDVVGGLLGVFQGLMLLMFVVIILNSYPLPPAKSGDVTQLRDIQNMIVNQSHIAGAIKQFAVPLFVHVFAILLPADLVSKFP
jgi:uncharacterized membrane protein required for colicin V production